MDLSVSDHGLVVLGRVPSSADDGVIMRDDGSDRDFTGNRRAFGKSERFGHKVVDEFWRGGERHVAF